MSNENKTPVKVRFYKEDGSILAIFPRIIESKSWNKAQTTVSCYSRVGQHSSAARGYYSKLPKATALEYAGLAEELKSIGYQLAILNKN